MNHIIWHNRAYRQVKKIPKHYREAILESVDELAEFPVIFSRRDYNPHPNLNTPPES